MLEKILKALGIIQASLPLAEIVVQFIERLIPGTAKGTIKKELALPVLRAARENPDVDPDSLAIDLAVGKLNATQGWGK